MNLLILICILSPCFSVLYGTVEIFVKETHLEIPPSNDVVCTARYIVHTSDWCSLSYISKNEATSGQPLSRTYSISDGQAGNSSGVVYFMVSPLDLTIQDLEKNNNCSIIMSLAQKHYCYKKHYDPQDPRCAQVILNGKFVQIQPNNTEEYNYAMKILWSRHPVMKFWYHAVPGHQWYFVKLEIRNIMVVNSFGGRKFPSVKDYLEKDCHRYLKTKNDFNSYTIIEENDI